MSERGPTGRELLLDACREFIRKVEAGEARSTRSYEQMKKAVAVADKEDALFRALGREGWPPHV